MDIRSVVRRDERELRTPQRLLLAGTAIATTVLLTACGTSTPTDSSAVQKATSTPAPIDEPAAADMELLAKVTTSAPPTDMTWSIPDSLPDGWKQLPIEDEAGVWQVQVTPTCIIDFRQPSGLGDADTPDSVTVAHDVAAEFGTEAIGAELEITPGDDVKLSAEINDGAMTAYLDFATVDFITPADTGLDVTGTTYALRNGDYALIATAMCGGGDFTDHGEQMRDFIETTQADITY